MILSLIVIGIIILLLFLYFLYPKLYAKYLRKKHLPKGISTAQFHDILIPVLMILSICTTYSAFHVQSQFNRHQMEKEEHNKAEKMIFEFINMHNNQVNRISKTNLTSGNKSFHYIYYEFRSLFYILREITRTDDRWEYMWDNGVLKNEYREDLSIIAFQSTLIGISQTSNTALCDWFIAEYNNNYFNELLHIFIIKVNDLQKLNESRVFYTSDILEQDYKDIVLKNKEILINETRYMHEYFSSDQIFAYADGHMAELDSHMRLLKTILVHFNKLNLKENEKTYFLDLLRSQLSTHELLIIFLYSLCDNDYDWFKEGLLSSKNKLKNNLVKDLKHDFIKYLVPNWELYITGNELTLDSLRSQRFITE